MDFAVWMAIGGAATLLLLVAGYFAPARTKIVIDTPTSTARAEMRLLWGIGPMFVARALPKNTTGTPLKFFNDTVRIGHALMTPGLADTAYTAISALFRLKPKVARLQLSVNLGDNAQNLVVQTAAEAALAVASSSVREKVIIGRSEAPGAELNAMFELDASPAHLASIYSRFKSSRAAKEFQRRLTRKIKPVKKPTKEVRA